MKDKLLAVPVFNAVKYISKRIFPFSGFIINGILLYEAYVKLKEKFPVIDSIEEEMKEKIMTKINEQELPDVVQDTLSVILRESLIAKNEVEKLLDSDFSKSVLGLDFPALRKVDANSKTIDTKVDGVNRYFSDVYEYGNEKYLITNAWQDDYQAKYLKWLKSIG